MVLSLLIFLTSFHFFRWMKSRGSSVTGHIIKSVKLFIKSFLVLFLSVYVKYPKNEFNSTTHICEIETKANVLLALYIIDSIILFIRCNKQEKQQGGESYALPFFLMINRHTSAGLDFFGFLFECWLVDRVSWRIDSNLFPFFSWYVLLLPREMK